MRALGRRLKQGYKFERGGGGHWQIIGRDGRLIEYKGRPITVADNPSVQSVRRFEEQLREAQVLRGTRVRVTDELTERRQAAARAASAVVQATRQGEANALRERYVALFAPMGGVDTPGLGMDLGHVAAYLLRDTPQEDGRFRTPDLLADNARRMLHGAWVDPAYSSTWSLVADRLEAVPDRVGEWYTLVREARGLPGDTVQLRLPAGAEDDWPFRVELLTLDVLFSDHEHYQRPVAWPFVRREAARFDPSLVGTIDVAQRSPSQFAILDGQQRSQIVRLVGKQTIWCSIYVGLDLASESRFFLHKNRDRKSVHPYYTFRALLTSQDADAIAIDEIVGRHGYALAIGAPSQERSANISAIAAVQTAYARRLPDGTDTLDPVLDTLKRSTLGRDQGQSSLLIRGLSATFVERPELERNLLVDALAQLGPDLVLGRARDLKRTTAATSEQAITHVLLKELDSRRRKKKRAA